MTTDAEIARAAVLRPIAEIGARAGLPADALYRYGPYKAKVSFDAQEALPERRGRLVLVTAISPTPAGEGKTTTTIGLGDALNRIGRRTIICLREPSLGPCFGLKGGANGGGRAQVVPQDEINLHLTGDFHALTAANNLLAAMIDNQVYWGNPLGLDPSRVTWRRALDMNDRALRDVVVGLGGNGAVRQDGFDLTVASETMAVFCLAASLGDLHERLGRMVIGQDFARADVRADAVKATGAMTALLRDAFQPNLVQTIDGSPALVHGGPFANIAHGCNSVVATDLGLRLADYVVTEAGFGADLGAEKFFDIKCRAAGLSPAVAVVVATVRALKMHGGVAKPDLGAPDAAAVRRGAANLRRHVENVRKFGVPVVVAINHFTADTEAELAEVFACCADLGVGAHLCRHWAEGGAGAADLAEAVAALADGGTARFAPLYPDALPLADKIDTVAREIYRADGVALSPTAVRKLARFEAAGHGHLPVCMAKTPYSFSADPAALGAPSGFTLPVRDVRLSAGAGFVVALCGDIVTMPGLPRRPAAETIHVDASGVIQGLF
ncbi:formate--tetrahydrofolate ligase [Lichenibacterium ramalinae]|uniref:Formate--tetrahydrofolate ligase n=1 Tax=Lichenibacterium ramalinae TaxID=2316527 RepID=A0A4Q2R8I5_9HYPH|nr:formate--tetrahydrofolate ligase [Lichenibacterium ramalinae]RYB03140.1 formate--tetrahydrofolate ligase [Lichenibacterium ramalinae]